MTMFDDRETAFESKFAHDADLRFRAEARAVKIMAHWAADILGKSEAEKNAYVPEVIAHDFRNASHDGVVLKLVGDLGGQADEAVVRARFQQALREAAHQVTLN